MLQHAITIGDALTMSGTGMVLAFAFLAFAMWKVNRGDWGNR